MSKDVSKNNNIFLYRTNVVMNCDSSIMEEEIYVSAKDIHAMTRKIDKEMQQRGIKFFEISSTSVIGGQLDREQIDLDFDLPTFIK